MAETLRLLAKGGRFRCVVPDLRALAVRYVQQVDAGDANASEVFMLDSCLGRKRRNRGIAGLAEEIFGNSRHLWMWDEQSLTKAALDAGFQNVRLAEHHDSADTAFADVEEASRFENAVAIEAVR